jgi:hypothetical protein
MELNITEASHGSRSHHATSFQTAGHVDTAIDDLSALRTAVDGDPEGLGGFRDPATDSRGALVEIHRFPFVSWSTGSWQFARSGGFPAPTRGRMPAVASASYLLPRFLE